MTGHAQRLAEAMSEISEDHWCAGWLIGLEHDLWGMLTGTRSTDYGLREVSDADLDELRGLSERAGGWIRWAGTRYPLAGPVFEPLTTWVLLHAREMDRVERGHAICSEPTK